MTVVVRGIDDLTDDALDRVLARAGELHRTGVPDRPATAPKVVGLAFLEASLRTRVGFSVAAARLGWRSVEVHAARAGPTSQPEPWTETLRVLSGMVDVVVARPGRPLDRASTARWSVAPVVNGGDVGPDAEHPTQALIDHFAIERLVGPIEELTVAVCGDLRMRAARSFLRLLARRPPRRLVVVTDPSIDDPAAVPASLVPITEHRSLPDVDDVDVISAVGLPDGATDPLTRRQLQVDRKTMDRLPTHGAVLSPMPVLDEVETAALDHPRVRLYEQSDLAVLVRMAILEEMVRS
jgi:aspartate carbamoyltransferase catalytic subunit